MTKEEIKEYIKDNFNLYNLKILSLTEDKLEFEFEGSLTFAMLDKLSKIFNTEDINCGSSIRGGGYCSTCEYTYTVVVLTIKNYKIQNQ